MDRIRYSVLGKPFIKRDKESVSAAIEEIKPEDWAEKVYKPDILNTPGKLYKKPGYSM